MARRKSNSSALSLFAFQDIITGVAGVMLFILMLLVVQLALQSAKRSAGSASAAEITLTEAQIEQQSTRLEQQRSLAELEALVQRRASEQKANKEKIDWLLDTNVQDFEQEMQAQRAKLERLLDRLAKARSSEQRLKSENKESQANNPADAILREIESLQKTSQLLEREMLEWQDSTRVNYTTQQKFTNLYLFDVQEKRISMTPLPSLDRQWLIEIGSSDSVTAIATKILDRYETLPRDKQDPKRRIVVLIRPSAAENASQLVVALRAKGFEVAMELLEAKAELFRRPSPPSPLPLEEERGR